MLLSRRPRLACLFVAALALAMVVPRATAATGIEGIPAFRHVVVLVLENESEEATFSGHTYVNGLRSGGVFLPNYYGTGHASLDNYVAMVSGQPSNGLTNSDCLPSNLYLCAQSTTPLGGRHLGDQLDAAGVSWKSYMDGTTRPCAHEAYSPSSPVPDPYQGNGNKPNTDGAGPDYADRHNPFVTFPDFVGDPARCAAHQRPFTELAGDITHDRVPRFAFITPDTCHDGHDDPCSGGQPGGLKSANRWLSRQLPSVLAYLAHHDGLLILISDEGGIPATQPQDASCSSCASGGAGGRTGAVLLSPRLPRGTTVGTGYDHDSLLRTIEDSFGITEHLNLAAQSVAMTEAFRR